MATERRYAVLTAIGRDRPGIVHEISQAINEAAGNLEDSRMAVLGGEFALIVLLSGVLSAVERLRGELPRIESRLGLRVTMQDTHAAEVPRGSSLYRLRVTGVDRPGIVVAISKTLASRGVNVVSLESRLANAPESGTPLFVLSTEIHLPSDVALSSLRQRLEEVCDAEDLDFSLESS